MRPRRLFICPEIRASNPGTEIAPPPGMPFSGINEKIRRLARAASELGWSYRGLVEGGLVDRVEVVDVRFCRFWWGDRGLGFEEVRLECWVVEFCGMWLY